MTNRTIIGVLAALLGAGLITVAFIDRNNFWIWLIPGVIPYVIFLVGIAMKCPKCGRWWASNEQGSEALDRWTETKDVERWDETRNKKGEVVSRTKRIEQVIVHCEKMRHYYRCRFCAAEWTEVKTHRDR